MATSIFRAEAIKYITSALKDYEAAAQLGHAGLTGKVREIAVAKVLRPFLPQHLTIGTGKLVDYRGILSPEIDLVLADTTILPPVLFAERFGVFPVESVAYAVEVKSRLTASNLEESIEKATKLRELQYSPGYFVADRGLAHTLQPVMPVLFAFDSDLSVTGKTELNRYREKDPGPYEVPALRAFCIRGKGYWWFKGDPPNRGWMFHAPTDEFDEVIDFLGGIINSLPSVLGSRGSPRIGKYLILEVRVQVLGVSE